VVEGSPRRKTLARAARLTDARIVRVRCVVVSLLFAGCHANGQSDDVRAAPPIPSSSAWAEASAATSDSASVATQRGDKEALAELLRAASARAVEPASSARALGGDTHLPGSGDVDVETPHALPAPAVSAAQTRHPGAGNDAIERSARAALYWDLTQHCKDESDRILPPESIEVRFDVDEEGYLVTSTITAIAKNPRFERAALCMRREVARSAYRAPPAARGVATHLKLWVPSTD
jgi:hypothetical protein